MIKICMKKISQTCNSKRSIWFGSRSKLLLLQCKFAFKENIKILVKCHWIYKQVCGPCNTAHAEVCNDTKTRHCDSLFRSHIVDKEAVDVGKL